MTSEEITQHITELIRTRHIATEKLTEVQLAEAIKQALACGDFTRYVRCSDGAQQVVYEPFRMVNTLENRISGLEAVLREIIAKEEVSVAELKRINMFEGVSLDLVNRTRALFNLEPLE